MTAAHLWALTQPSEPPLDPRPSRPGLLAALLAAWVLSIVLGLGVLLSGCSSPEMEARRKPVQRKTTRRPVPGVEPKMDSSPRYPTCAGPDFGGDPPRRAMDDARTFWRVLSS